MAEDSAAPDTPASPSAGAAAGSDLARLLEAERRLEAMLAERRAEAERIVDDARRWARRRTAEVDGEIRAAEEELVARIRDETKRRVGEAREEGRRRAERWRAAAEDVGSLADLVVRRVLGAGDDGP